MRVLRGCKMTSLAMYGGKRMLLGFLLFVSYVPLVWTTNYTSLDATSSKLKVGDRLISSPNPYFELGIFEYNYSGPTGGNIISYYLAIRYAFPIESVVTWMANRNNPISSTSVLQFKANGTGGLNLFDPLNNEERNSIWSTSTDNMEVVSAQLLDTGNLVLMNKNGTHVWSSFKNSPPTDTLLPGQGMNLSQNHNLTSWQRTGNPAIVDMNDTYFFGWDAKRVLTLIWTCPKVFLNWKGGPYIPAHDVYAAHTIQNVDNVYFHESLGHLYIGSKVPTAILSGGSDRVNVSTMLKRITISWDGGLRILQYKIFQPWNEALQLNERWKAVANWVVSDRPDTRSQCTAFGTCGQFSECISPIDSLEPVTCRCPGMDNNATRGWFKPIDINNPNRGCHSPNEMAVCEGNKTGTYSYKPTNPPSMLVLPGVDMPWGGDYENITGNDSINCMQRCMEDCRCAGAVYSKAEQMCWKKTAALYNLGYPTEALHGTDRTSYLRNQTIDEPVKLQVAKKDNKWVKILVPAIGIPGVLLIVLVIFCLWHKFRRPPPPDVMEFPGDK